MSPTNKTSIIFFGTEHFASVILLALLQDTTISVERVITQPDKAVGRKQVHREPPVKICAKEYSIPVDQPERLRGFELQNTTAILGIVVEYGLLIPRHILESFPFGIVNVHPSLLPAYRGASPIQTAILDGKRETGVTIMRLDEGLDTGPILVQQKQEILPDDTTPVLSKKLADLGARMLVQAIPRYLGGSLIPHSQKNEGASLTRPFTREDGRIVWEKMTAIEVYHRYRAFLPWPGIWTLYKEKRLKLLSIALSDALLKPGEFLHKDNRLFIGCSDGSIEVKTLQMEGRKPLSVEPFLRGHV